MDHDSELTFRLPQGICSFHSIRKDDQIYVDKTEQICSLVEQKALYFFSRPRRFGKTLLVSTIHSLFEDGLKDFKGLAIERKWDENSERNRDCLVMHLDFSGMDDFSSIREFKAGFYEELDGFMKAHPVADEPTFNSARTTIGRFKAWLTGRERIASAKLVLLVDEYDAPLNSCLGDPELFKKVASALSQFYKVIKGHTGALRFMFITGICRFRHTTIFSGFNNLADITMDSDYGMLLGYTEDELRHYFSPYIERSAKALGISYEECITKMKENYDGFCFDEEAKTHVFCPWSVLKFLIKPKNGFKNYWYGTGGTPSVLMNYVQGHSMQDPMSYGKDRDISIDALNSAKELADIDDISLLTQTGYLSIKKCNGEGYVTVNYPNREVASSMARLYTDLYMEKSAPVMGLASMFEGEHGAQEQVDRLNVLIGRINYQKFPIQNEYALQSVLQLCFASAGLHADVEVVNNIGRSDLEVQAGKNFYVFELKYAREGDNPDILLEQAVSQIKEKHYGEYSYPELKHIRMALVFSGKDRLFVRSACLDA